MVSPLYRPLAAGGRLAFYLVLASAFVLILFKARREYLDEQRFWRSLAAVAVEAPEGSPPVSQASIELAIAMYGIEVPSSAAHPRLDRDLRDRGLTTRGAFLEKAQVTVGPAAFSSWGLLGSTLAHELEIHCKQNFLLIYIMDLIGLDGTSEAERQAYRHELAHAKRFGLEHYDTELISDTVSFYYPENTGNELAMTWRVRQWLARNLMAAREGL